MNGIFLGNSRAILSNVGLSVQRVLRLREECHRNVATERLYLVLDQEQTYLELFDEFMEQYVLARIEDGLSHDSAFQEVVSRLEHPFLGYLVICQLALSGINLQQLGV